jgi:hypothetical protein
MDGIRLRIVGLYSFTLSKYREAFVKLKTLDIRISAPAMRGTIPVTIMAFMWYRGRTQKSLSVEDNL